MAAMIKIAAAMIEMAATAADMIEMAAASAAAMIKIAAAMTEMVAAAMIEMAASAAAMGMVEMVATAASADAAAVFEARSNDCRGAASSALLLRGDIRGPAGGDDGATLRRGFRLLRLFGCFRDWRRRP